MIEPPPPAPRGDGSAGRVPLRRGVLPCKRVVIVDDSPTMRRWLRHLLDNDTRLEVVGEASNAQAARAVIKAQNPDVITLDIEMPGISGLEFLEHLMRLRPLPVVMVSSATRQGSDAAVQALSLGAVDCVLKPQSAGDHGAQRDLVRRVFSAACSTLTTEPQMRRDHAPASLWQAEDPLPLILLGASTGGVAALECILGGLNPTGPPVVIVQHMPGPFLVSFTKMLDRKLPQTVQLLRDGEALPAGSVTLAPAVGHRHAGVTRVGKNWTGTLQDASPDSPYCPSIDMLFSSAVAHAPDVIAGLLTGLGRDGAQGMKQLHDAGATTLGQDRASCVVYGMPRAAFEIGAVTRQVPLHDMARAINTLSIDHKYAQGAGPR